MTIQQAFFDFIKIQLPSIQAFPFKVVTSTDGSYDKDREISNSYFNLKPKIIAYPTSIEQVAICVNFCREKGIKLSIRSGGHQHEGMCSGNGVFMIRLSEMNKITPSEDENKVWLDVGCKLGDVYEELEKAGKTIPGGGCFNVNIGGLTQGGGWGMNVRQHGLTCDNIVKARIVLADGSIKEISPTNEPDLFMAIRGGGGGNFGVVTSFLFKLVDFIPTKLSSFRFFWEKKDMEAVIVEWLKQQRNYPNALTSFLRLTSVPENQEGSKKTYPIYMSGLFHGVDEELRKWMKNLIDAVPPAEKKFIHNSLGGENNDFTSFNSDNAEKQSFSQLFFNYDVFERIEASSLQNDSCSVAPPESNCNAPHPHKVSSAFSKSKLKNRDEEEEDNTTYYQALAKDIALYMSKHPTSPSVRSYMTFHSMGGAIALGPKEGKRAFPYGDREFLLQFQSWWNYPESQDAKDKCRNDKKRQQPYIDWVKNFRKSLASHVEGAFINFVDKDLGPNLTTPQGKYDLLKYYYGQNLDRLIEIKKEYDRDNLFNFEMSIPTQKP